MVLGGQREAEDAGATGKRTSKWRVGQEEGGVGGVLLYTRKRNASTPHHSGKREEMAGSIIGVRPTLIHARSSTATYAAQYHNE